MIGVKTLSGVALALTRRDPASVLFPAIPGSVTDQLEALQAAYRQLVVLVHPDHNPRDVQKATTVLANVNALRAKREAEIRDRGAPQLPGGKSRGPLVRHGSGRPLGFPDDGYDDTALPPLPACDCIVVARATLPGRVVFCERDGVAVRQSDQKTIPMAHEWACSRYRQTYPEAVTETGVVLHGPAFSRHSPGWTWVHARLTANAGRDYFAGGRR